MAWDKARELVSNGSTAALACLGRMPMQHAAYRKFRDQSILSHYASVADYLHYIVFGVARKMNQGEDECLIVNQSLFRECA